MKKLHWFDFVEYLSLIGVGTGTILSLVSKQFLYSSAPMSLALLIGFANRRRVEQAQEQHLADSLSNLEQKQAKDLELIDQQMQNLPTPEMIGDVRQSILRHNRDTINKKLHAYATTIQREVENRLNSLEQQNLGDTREEISHLQLQYSEMYNTLKGVLDSLRQVATEERVNAVDQAIAQLMTESEQAQSSLQTLKEYSNHTLANLQDQVNQLSRQFKSLPPHVDASSIKREISELVRVVADLVPKRDLQAVATDLREVQQRQTAQLQIEETLRRELQEVNQRLQSVPDVPHLRSQLEESFTQQIRTINHQLRTLYSSPALRTKIEEVLQAEFGNLQTLIAERLPSSPYDLVFDLSTDAADVNGAYPDDQTNALVPGSRKAFMDAIDKTQERLILIWPWSAQMDLDGEVMHQLERLLAQNRRLDVGWCYVSDRHQERFLSIINRRWSIHPLGQENVQKTLKRLLAIKRHYPDSFRFKVLGTAENFLISDEAFAILGLDARLKTQTFLRNVDLKLRTTDQQVIQQLIQRFDEADPPADDIDAYWNRAVTRYDLGDKAGAIADLNKILTVPSRDPAVYNLRGIIRYEQKDLAGALEDLNASIALNPEQHAVYCNRGYLHSEMGDQYGAIADFSLAIQVKPDSALALFYRGAASQKLEDYDGAIVDYTNALTYAPTAPVVLYQRGMVFQKMGLYREAIADLAQAAQAFADQGSDANAHKAQKMLEEVGQQALESAPKPAGELESAHDLESEDAIEGELNLELNPELKDRVNDGLANGGLAEPNGDRPVHSEADGRETLPLDLEADGVGAIAPVAEDAAQSTEISSFEPSITTESESPPLTFNQWEARFQASSDPFPDLASFDADVSPVSASYAPPVTPVIDHSVESIVWDMNDSSNDDNREAVDSIDTLFSDFGSDMDTAEPEAMASDTLAPESPESIAPESSDPDLFQGALTTSGAESDPLEPEPLDLEASEAAALELELSESDVLEPNSLEPDGHELDRLILKTSDLNAPDLNTPDLNTPDLNTPDLNTPDLNAPDLNALTFEAVEPDTTTQDAAGLKRSDPTAGRPPVHQASQRVPAETDTQQIGTQTLADFFSIINAEGGDESHNPTLFAEDDFWSLPDSEDAADDAHRNPEDPSSTVSSNHGGATDAHAMPDSTSAPPTTPARLDDVFPSSPDYENDTVPPSNGFNRHVEPTDRANGVRPELAGQSFQTIDEESLADFCERFIF